MPTHQSLHKVHARSITARISPETPKEAQLMLMLENGEFLAVQISRIVLKRLVGSAESAMNAVPLPFRGLSKASRPATSRSK
jgi:hypothetical protein